MLGLIPLIGAELIVKEKNLPMTAHEFLERREKIIVQLFPDCQPMPGITQYGLIQHINIRIRRQGVS